jgi:CRP-like cAMP-binding protein
MTVLEKHPEKNLIRLQLSQNCVLRSLDASAMADLERHLEISDLKKSEILLHQGDHQMEQYFVLDGILKRIVSSADAKEMILRFAIEKDIETSYAAWRLKTAAPYSVASVTKARVARMPLKKWAEFLEEHKLLKETFEFEVMRLMSEIMAHTITLHMLDAPGRVEKELAAYLNLSPETLSRLKSKHKELFI